MTPEGGQHQDVATELEVVLAVGSGLVFGAAVAVENHLVDVDVEAEIWKKVDKKLDHLGLASNRVISRELVWLCRPRLVWTQSCKQNSSAEFDSTLKLTHQIRHATNFSFFDWSIPW